MDPKLNNNPMPKSIPEPTPMPMPNPIVPNPVSAPNPPGFPEPVKDAPVGASSSGKGMKYAIVGMIIVVLLILIGGGIYYFFFMTKKAPVTTYNTVNQTATYAAKVTPTPTPIQAVKGADDLNGLLNELNSADTTSIESDYKQAVTASSNL